MTTCPRDNAAPPPSPLLTIKEVSAYLRLSEAYLYILIARKHLPVIKLGKRTFIAQTSADDYIAKNTRAAVPTTPKTRGRPPKFPARRKAAAEHRAPS